LTLLNFQVVEKCSQDILRAAGREGERERERKREIERERERERDASRFIG
jgi:hypothetical protein